MVAARADLEARNQDGSTPLHLAARDGAAEVVTTLLEAGADLEARDAIGRTPLHRAGARFGSPDPFVVAGLLDAGADPNTRDNDGKLPFDYARDNKRLRGTDACWKLNAARFE